MLPLPTVPLQAVPVTGNASSLTDTFYHPRVTAQCAVIPVALDPVEARRQKRADVSAAPKTVPTLTVAPPAQLDDATNEGEAVQRHEAFC